ncbi:uncharacterized protein [Lolium perenne]|uniref:uncharacterized protein n=1 Tax=Lolium perenne TaxID=4522 RepID=UPI0021F57853|nr:uncharacterized protein LOC127327500 [Lolium perenne]
MSTSPWRRRPYLWDWLAPKLERLSPPQDLSGAHPIAPPVGRRTGDREGSVSALAGRHDRTSPSRVAVYNERSPSGPHGCSSPPRVVHSDRASPSRTVHSDRASPSRTVHSDRASPSRTVHSDRASPAPISAYRSVRDSAASRARTSASCVLFDRSSPPRAGVRCAPRRGLNPLAVPFTPSWARSTGAGHAMGGARNMSRPGNRFAVLSTLGDDDMVEPIGDAGGVKRTKHIAKKYLKKLPHEDKSKTDMSEQLVTAKLPQAEGKKTPMHKATLTKLENTAPMTQQALTKTNPELLPQAEGKKTPMQQATLTKLENTAPMTQQALTKTNPELLPQEEEHKAAKLPGVMADHKEFVEKQLPNKDTQVLLLEAPATPKEMFHGVVEREQFMKAEAVGGVPSGGGCWGVPAGGGAGPFGGGGGGGAGGPAGGGGGGAGGPAGGAAAGPAGGGAAGGGGGDPDGGGEPDHNPAQLPPYPHRLPYAQCMSYLCQEDALLHCPNCGLMFCADHVCDCAGYVHELPAPNVSESHVQLNQPFTYVDHAQADAGVRIFVGASREGNIITHHFARVGVIFGHGNVLSVEAYRFRMQGLWIVQMVHAWPVVLERAYMFPQPQFHPVHFV